MFPFFNLHYASNVKNNTYLQLKTFIFFDFFSKPQLINSIPSSVVYIFLVYGKQKK